MRPGSSAARDRERRDAGAFAEFARLPPAEWALALEALLLLLLAKLLSAGVPMRWWRRHLDMAEEPPPSGAPAAATRRLASECAEASGLSPRRAGRIVRKVARRAPFRTRCLARAMAAQWMLRRRGVASRLLFGVRRRGAPPALAFHAWLCVDGQPVIGGVEADGYSPFPADGPAGGRIPPGGALQGRAPASRSRNQR